MNLAQDFQPADEEPETGDRPSFPQPPVPLSIVAKEMVVCPRFCRCGIFELKGGVIVNELQRYLVEEAVEDYEEGRLSRREALKAIAGIKCGVLASQIL